MKLRFVLAAALLLLGVNANPVPGVTESNRTVSCCKFPEIDLTHGCEHTLEIEDKVHARVEKFDTLSQGPFQRKIHTLVNQRVDFTYKRACPVGVNQLSEVITHFKLPPCTKDSCPNAAPALQGSMLYLLLVLALRMFL